MWYALVQDEQLGPMAANELGELFTSGVINPETFIWREGMPEWLPLKSVPEFQEITLGAVADLGLYDYANEGDDDDEEGATLMIGAGEAAGWSDYLEQLAENAPPPPMQSEPPAAVSPRIAPPSQPPVDPVAHTEAMMSPFEGGAAPAPPAPLRSAFDAADEPQAPFAMPEVPASFEAPELAAPLEFGAEFSSPPVPGPVVPDGGGAGKTALLFVLLLLLGGGGAMLFMYLRTPEGPPPSPGAQAVSSAPPVVAVVAKDAAPPVPDAAVPDAVVLDAAVPDAAVEADAMVLEAIDIADEPDAGKGKAPVKLSPAEVARRREARRKRLAAMKAAEEKKRAARAKAAHSNLPKALGRGDIQSVVRANADRISACAAKDAKAKGHASVRIVIERSGVVSRAKVVTARLRRSPAGDCVEKAIKGLKFPRFSGDAMRINLPLKL